MNYQTIMSYKKQHLLMIASLPLKQRSFLECQ
jgi:hypothetical protein